MHKPGIGLAIIAGIVIVAMAGQARSDSDKNDKADLAKAAKITVDQAIKTATEKTPGKVIEVELEKEDGKVLWEIEVVTAEGKVAKMHVDAESGAIIAKEHEKPKKEGKRKRKPEKKD